MTDSDKISNCSSNFQLHDCGRREKHINIIHILFIHLGKNHFPSNLKQSHCYSWKLATEVFRVSPVSLHAEQFLSLYPYSENEMAKGRGM